MSVWLDIRWLALCRRQAIQQTFLYIPPPAIDEQIFYDDRATASYRRIGDDVLVVCYYLLAWEGVVRP